MKTQVEKLPKSAIKLTVTVPVDKVKEMYAQVLDEVVKNTELPGFRKGLAPKELVKEKTDISKLYGDVVNDLLQKYYPQALKETLIAPVSNPKVEIKEFDLEKEFEFTAIIATRPEIKIGDYKTKLRAKYDTDLKKAKEANAEKLKNGEKIGELHVHLSTNDIIDALTDTSEVEVADVLTEEETERTMSRLVDQAQSIGLSLDQYLKAQNKTAEQLKADYTKAAERSIKAEFLLSQLAKDLAVEVTDAEIEEAFAAAGESMPKDKLNDSMEKWYIKSILEKNKVISKIMEEMEGENFHGHSH